MLFCKSSKYDELGEKDLYEDRSSKGEIVGPKFRRLGFSSANP